MATEKISENASAEPAEFEIEEIEEIDLEGAGGGTAVDPGLGCGGGCEAGPS